VGKLAKRTQKVRNQENQQDGTKAYTGASTNAISAMTVETTAAAENQNQNND
jgi:hypothetical protein